MPASGYSAPPAGYPAGGYPYPYPGPLRPVPVAPSGEPLAEFSDRLVAAVVDTVIVTAATIVGAIPAGIGIAVLLTRSIGPEPGGTAPPDVASDIFLPILAIEAALVAFILIVTYIYDVEMMFRRGQTIGKRVMKIRVVPLDPAAGPLTRGMAVRRWLIWRLAAAFVPLLQWLDGLWQLWDQPYRQCLHDKVAKTTVVKVVGQANREAR